MSLETHRKALREGLPWLVVALILLVPSIAVPACAAPFLGTDATSGWIEKGAWASGALGSGCMLLGLLQLARARSGGRTSFALYGAFLAWAAELALRLYTRALDEPAGDVLLVLRLIAASAAMTLLASGMAWLLRRQQAAREVAPWSLARVLFTAFLLGVTGTAAWLRWGTAGVELWTWVEGQPLGAPLAWLAFALPWLALVRAVRRSVRVASRTQSVSEILTRW